MLYLDAKSQMHKSRLGENKVNSTEDWGDTGETVNSRIRMSHPRGGLNQVKRSLQQVPIGGKIAREWKVSFKLMKGEEDWNLFKGRKL